MAEKISTIYSGKLKGEKIVVMTTTNDDKKLKYKFSMEAFETILGSEYNLFLDEVTSQVSKGDSIVIQGKKVSVTVFEEMIEMSLSDFISTVKMLDLSITDYSSKMLDLKLKTSNVERAKTSNTKRVLINPGATDYLRKNHINYIDCMYRFEGKVAYVVDKEEFDMISVAVPINPAKKLAIKVSYHKDTLTHVK